QPIRPTNSLRYIVPKNSPSAVNASASASLSRIRVRIRTPAGAAATTGSPIRRNRLPPTMSTSSQPPPTLPRPRPASPLTSTRYHSLPLTTWPNSCSPFGAQQSSRTELGFPALPADAGPHREPAQRRAPMRDAENPCESLGLLGKRLTALEHNHVLTAPRQLIAGGEPANP